ncbi:MAG TPA: TetR family transcriptional regulator C-terminal domain-containing protein, partial [Chloroflexota bacterium]
RLIEACISALHIHGPSRTTVEKVVALADLSPGIVRFYFDSKDAMLVASLAYLAAEFEERVMAPVSSLKDTPVKALEQLVELYLDPQIASPRKVSVWYSFWGEASSRQEYLEICGNKDEAFAALVRELIEAMIIRTAQSHLDADAVALGLIGVLEVLWQGFAFTEEARIDRDAAKRRSLAYLGSVFPGHFQRPGGLESRQVGSQAGNLPAWAYSDATLLGLERDRLFRPSWQLVGHEADLPNPGDYLTADLAGERVLLVKIGERDFRAFRNACRRRPHALLTGVRGHLSDGIACKVHGLVYELDGRLHSGDTPGNLTTLQLALHGGFILVHAVGVASAGVSVSAVPGLTGAEWQSIPDLQPDGVADTLVAADWKLIMEQWIEAPPRPPGTQRTFLPPNQVLERSERGVMFLQVIPQAPGRSVIRRRDYSVAAVRSNSRSRGPQVSRGEPGWLRQDIEVAESTQAGLAAGIEEADDTGPLSPQLVDFRRTITALLPLARSGGD